MVIHGQNLQSVVVKTFGQKSQSLIDGIHGQQFEIWNTVYILLLVFLLFTEHD